MGNSAHDSELFTADDDGAGDTTKHFDHDEKAKSSVGLAEMDHQACHQNLNRHGDDQGPLEAIVFAVETMIC